MLINIGKLTKVLPLRHDNKKIVSVVLVSLEKTEIQIRLHNSLLFCVNFN